jgi:hypothetical protein
MSFDLAVLAMDVSADAHSAKAMFEVCGSLGHPEGDLDPRIVTFYEALRHRFPDYAPYDDHSPWADMPLYVGIDHVIMHIRFGPAGQPAIEVIQRLASDNALVLWDPQGEDAYLP